MDSVFAKQLLEKTHRDYDAIADSWHATRERLQSDTIQLFASLVADGVAVLDVGCGNGRLIDALRGKNCIYTGVDVSERLVDIAHARYPEDGPLEAGGPSSPYQRFMVGDILALPFPNESFDALAVISVLHHIPSDGFRQQALRECLRVLKPGGLCFVSNWNLLHWTFLRRYRTWRLLFGKTAQHVDRGDVFIPWKRDVAQPVMRYIHVFRASELARLFRATGFASIECLYVLHGRRAHWWSGHNLVTIARK